MTSISKQQTNWKTIRVAGVQRMERVVAEFYVECSYIPSRYFRVKVTEDGNGQYIGRVNVSIKNAHQDAPEWVVGLGSSMDVALEDAIHRFIQSLEQSGKDQHRLTDADFEWAACEDF